MKTRSLIFVGLMSLSTSVSAQELLCPQTGIPMSRDPGCVIPNNANALPPQELPQESRQPQPAGHWEKTWGAIAGDNVTGSLGTVVGMSNQQAAEHAALADCRKKGGRQCEIGVSYSNGCASMIIGDQRYTMEVADTLDKAIKVGMEKCSNRNDTNCRIIYRDCSKPTFVSH